MRLFTTILGLRCYLESCRLKQHDLERSGSYLDGIIIPLEIGFVPTMGALHAGHLSLIQRARRENKIVVVSIFVNPLQFAPTEDFQRYPRSIEQDQALCEQANVDALFVPDAEEMGTAKRMANAEWRMANSELKTPSSKLKTQNSKFKSAADADKTPNPVRVASPKESPQTPNPTLTQVLPPLSVTSELCGRFREGHFQGVATIVTKLLTIVQPTRAYFGQKDAQQLAVIHQLVKDLNLPVEILECAIAREASGLALSSRNQYLTDTERQQASTIYQALQHASHAFQAGERLGSTLIGAVKAVLTTAPDLISEYVELVHPMTMTPLTQIEDTGLLAVAARIGSTRLIDNVLLSDRKPIVAIDGPAGAGKSTVARLVAQTLGLFHLDTGAMYRALTWLVMQSGIAIDDEPAIAELVSQCQIEFREQGAGGREQEGENPIPKLKTPTQNSKAQSAADANKTQNSKLKTQNSLLASPTIFVNGQDVTQAIRSLEVTSQVSAIAAQPAVRWALVRQQQLYGKQGGIVVEGRDIGTNVFPDAELKIFLTASVQERARRRQRDLQNQGIGDVNLDELEQAICDRDRKDSTRSLAPLRKADDAIELITDGLTIQAVIDQIVEQYNAAINF